MKVLGIYGSPRAGGNSDLLLDRALEGAAEAGAVRDRVYVRDVSISGCLECGACEETGACVIPDQMEEIYPRLQEARVIVMAAPCFLRGPGPIEGPGRPVPGPLVRTTPGEVP